MLFTFIPFLFHGVWLTLRQYPPLLVTPLLVAILLVIVHSLIGHKEFRFILPSLTLFMPYIGKRGREGREEGGKGGRDVFVCILGFSVSHLLQRKTGRGILILMEITYYLQ